MTKSEFIYLLDLYRRNQEKQLNRLAKLNEYILEHNPNSEYFMSIMAMTEPGNWEKEILKELNLNK